MNNDIYVTRASMPPYEEYIDAIRPLWDSHWLTNMGTYHQQLEQELAIYLDVPQISLIVNGHMALELALQLFDFPEGSEVITTPFTFISTTHAILRNRLKPVFCDVKVSDGTIDESKIEALITERTVAILPVHVYGHICNVKAIKEIAERRGLKVIYDAAHAFGEKIKVSKKCGEDEFMTHSNDEWRGIGNYGDACIFSFHATKVYNTIEGGAVVCNDRSMYDKLYNLKNFGIRGQEKVVSVGANGKMNEFSAVMGLLNLKYIEKAIKDRKRVYKRYLDLLKNRQCIRIFSSESDKFTYNYAYFPVIISQELSRNTVYEKLAEHRIHARKYFYPLTSDMECFQGIYDSNSLSVARNLADSVLCLPIYEGLEDEVIDEVIGCMEIGK